MLQLFPLWIAVIAVSALPIAATSAILKRRSIVDPTVRLVTPLLVSGLLGFLTFFAFLLHPLVGKIFATTFGLLLPAFILWTNRRLTDALDLATWRTPALLMTGWGLCFLCLLYLPALNHPAEYQSAFRYMHELPADPVLPEYIGDRLYAGESLIPFVPGWQSSDRPPLQSGMYLVIKSLLAPLPFEPGLLYQCVGTWLQLFWIPAVWLLCRRLSLSHLRSVCVIGLVATTGFAVVNSVFVWPKLLSGAFGLIVGLLLLDEERLARRETLPLAAIAAALAWLAHGGIAFSFLALPLCVMCVRGAAGRWRQALLALCLFALLALPWVGYQKCYDPPGNRLLKWHLAGVSEPDPRPVGETIRTAYHSLDFSTWLKNKSANLRRLTDGHLSHAVNFISTPAKVRRGEDFFFLLHSIGALGLGWLLLPSSRKTLSPDAARLMRRLFAWSVTTLALWILLMFEAESTVIHQGSYTTILVLFGGAAVLAATAPRIPSAIIVTWHLAYFCATWPLYFGTAHLRPEMIAGLVVGLGVAALALRSPVLSVAQDAGPR